MGSSEETHITEKPVASFKFRQRGTGPQLGEYVDEIKCAAQKNEKKDIDWNSTIANYVSELDLN